ncbi:hypothetical protein BVY04_05205 [bacterium M21]|nr:hypothetical protein BVY04_05205 [bacterium M21]
MSNVEQTYLERSGLAKRYMPMERANSIIVENFPELGRLTALRFVEWVQSNAGGVISLPTGKTPEHFIKWVQFLVNNWEEKEAQDILKEHGIDGTIKPDMKSLHFVQMDEFYPINSAQHNSFCNYVKKYYVEGFGFDPAKALVIDCTKIGLEEGETLDDVWPDGSVDLTLRDREGDNALEARQKLMLQRVDAWCDEYERTIEALGGIGFFLGGIGPDGHVAFNTRGSAHYSTTRLMHTNYETQAAAAGDLGGIEVSGTKPVITIGLGTITRNKDCTAIIMAAGEAKASIVADAIQNDPDPVFPGTALQSLPNGVFYLTQGAAKLLERRQMAGLEALNEATPNDLEHAIVDLSLSSGKTILSLTDDDITGNEACAILLAKLGGADLDALKQSCHDSMVEKIEKGYAQRNDTTFLHTEPHHDDIMLGYQPALVRDLHDESTEHYFTTLTSGFTAVTSPCAAKRVNAALTVIAGGDADKEMSLDAEINQFIYGLAAKDEVIMADAEGRRFIRCVKDVFGLTTMAEVEAKLEWLLEYLGTGYPGKKDIKEVQTLKGMIREWEIETLWGAFGIKEDHVSHLRLGFYQGDIFTEEPTQNRDVPPIVDLISKVNADILTVAFDPEASGPDTHYKVLQAVAAAVRQVQLDGGKLPGRIWGYRNVWYRFHPADTNLIVPVSRDELAVMHQLFMETFVTQRNASFPSFEHNGPFSELSQRIQVEQFAKIQTCLGDNWFRNHENPRVRSTCAMVFLSDMTVEQFLSYARDIRKQAENK